MSTSAIPAALSNGVSTTAYPPSVSSNSQRSHKSSRPHLPHPHRTHHHHHHHHHSNNDNKLATPQSAVQQTSHSPFGELLSKTASRTLPEAMITGGGMPHLVPALVPSQKHLSAADASSRNTSTAAATDHSGVDKNNDSTAASRDTSTAADHSSPSTAAAAAAKAEADAAAATERHKRQKWTQVQHLRAQRTQTEADLHRTLTSLSTLSTTTTRRLDSTFTSLLTSLSTLRTGISHLHNLAHSSRDLSTQFHTRAADLTQEVTTAVSSAETGFERQAKRIETLAARLQRSRERARRCAERTAGLRVTVDECRRVEIEQRRRRRGYWRRGLGGLCGVLLALLVLLVGVRVRSFGRDSSSATAAVAVLEAIQGRDLLHMPPPPAASQGDGEGFWGRTMENGTVGAQGLKETLEDLRDATRGDEGVDGDGDQGGGLQKGEEQGREGDEGGLSYCRRREVEGALRLFDEL